MFIIDKWEVHTDFLFHISPLDIPLIFIIQQTLSTHNDQQVPNLSWPLSLVLTTTYWTGPLPSNQASGFSPLDKSQTADLPCFRSNSTSQVTASGKSRTSSYPAFLTNGYDLLDRSPYLPVRSHKALSYLQSVRQFTLPRAQFNINSLTASDKSQTSPALLSWPMVTTYWTGLIPSSQAS